MENIAQFFNRVSAQWEDENYCAHGTKEPENRECYCCSLVNYGLDCHNNPIRNNEEK